MDSKIIDKIGKLLKLAESPNMEEASSALEKANQLLKEHNLQMSDISEKSDLKEVIYGESGRIVTWKKILLNEIAQFNYCTIILSKTYLNNLKNGASRFIIYGREDNIVSTKMMYEYLVSAIDRISENERKSNKYFNINDFKNGAVQNIARRLSLMKIRENNEEKGLVVLNKESQDFMLEKNPDIKEVSIKTKRTSSFEKGLTEAESISLNNQIHNFSQAKERIA